MVSEIYRELETLQLARNRLVGGTGVLMGARGFEWDESLAAGLGRERAAPPVSLGGMTGVGSSGGPVTPVPFQAQSDCSRMVCTCTRVSVHAGRILLPGLATPSLARST
jgi:hypothetical protein